MSMRHPDIDFTIATQHRRDEMAEVARDRLVKEAEMAVRMGRGRRPLLFVRAVDQLLLVFAKILSSVGGRMLNWSYRLQTRDESMTRVAAEKWTP